MMKQVCDSKDEKYENIWGIPDWRDEGQYPSEDISIDAWKWEFTRRSEEYQNIWQEYEQNYDEWNTKKKDGMSIAHEAAIKFKLFRLKHPNPTIHDPFLSAEESRNFALSSKCVLANDDYFLQDFIKKAKALNHCLVSINPRIPLEPQLKNLKKMINESIAVHEEKFSDYTYSDLDFDVRTGRLVDDDEIKTKLDLLRSKKKTSRHKTENYQLYLRLLDARNLPKLHRPTWKEITSHLNDNGMAGYTIHRFKSLHKKAIKVQKNFLRI